MLNEKSLLKRVHKIFTKRFGITVSMALVIMISFSYLLTAQNVYIITDDDDTIVHKSSTSFAVKALEEAGIDIDESDIVDMPENPVNGIAEITIKRSRNVTIVQGNKETEIQSHGETVLSLLTRAGIRLESGDDVTPSLITHTRDGMEIVIKRKNTGTLILEETSEYINERIPSIYIDKGEERLVTAGENGKKIVTYEIFVQDGVEIYRNPIAEEIIVPHVNEVIEYGSGGTITTSDGRELNFTRAIDVTATAYSTEGQKNKRTALGTTARVGAIAVDPKVIPLRTRVYVESQNGSWVYGEAVCEDTGGAIKGNIIDLYFNTQKECYKFGRQPALLYILE